MRRLDLQGNQDTGNRHAGDVDRRLRYGGAWFSAASALPLTRGSLSRRLDSMLRRRDSDDPMAVRGPALARCGATLHTTVNALGVIAVMVGAGICRPSRVVALIALVMRTQCETVSFSDSQAGQTLRAYFTRSCLGVLPLNRLCRGVLVLPERHADYLRGHRREAVRRNLRRAAAAGITCEPIGNRSQAAELLTQLARSRESPMTSEYTRVWREAIHRPETELFVAVDPDGEPRAVAGIVADDMVGLIRFAMANHHEARWALHDHIVATMIERRVRYLIAEGGGAFGALGHSPSIQRYQHLHGYELRHLKLYRPPVPAARLARTTA